MANDLPTPQSYEQLLSDMLSAYAGKLGINDFNIGSANTSFFEVVALATARASGDLFQILRDFSVDRATGDALKRLAQEYGVIPMGALVTTGLVRITDSSFNKVSTKIYAGTNPPNIGSTSINVSDASLFTPGGEIYIGRGTSNIEGPLTIDGSPTQIGGYWNIALTAPTSFTTKFHNLGESVILAQGGTRTVPVNTKVLSPGIGSNPDIQYSVSEAAIILDGETVVDNVKVKAQSPGASSNVPAGAVKTFSSAPFTGATVTNILPFVSGSDNETDDQLRIRIKRALASKGLGTATAVKSALIGATASDEQATIVSDSLVINTNGSATVYIDDSTGYEAKSQGVGKESIVDSALGGEQFFTLQTGGRQAPVAKAFLQSTLTAPYDLVDGDTLAVIVGGITYQHVFSASDFRSPGSVTAFEIATSINDNTALAFESTTAGSGQFVVLRAKAEQNDDLAITTPNNGHRDAAPLMGFSSNKIETLRLYKDNVPLSKDGATASVFSQAQQLWSATISNGDTLVLSVDGTADITYTITDADFIATGLYTSVSPNNSLASWVEVFNNKLTGVTASIVGQQLELTSNLGVSGRAAITIELSSTLVAKGMFTASLGLSSQGATSDFTLDRNTAQFELAVPLVAGEKLSAGTADTEATILGAPIPGGSVTFASDAHIWMLIDNPGVIIPTGVLSGTTLTVSQVGSNTVRYTSSSTNAFAAVNVGDYVIIWSAELSAGNRLEGRVHAINPAYLEITVTATEYAATSGEAPTFLDGFVVLRSTLAPQKFRIQTGSKTLNQIATELQLQTSSLLFSVVQQSYLSIRTVTMDTTGSLMIVAADTEGKLAGLPLGSSSTSTESLIAFYDSGDQLGQLPLFIHTSFAAGTAANPIDSYISSFVSSVSLAGRDPNELVGILHPYGVINDAQPYGEFLQETSIVTTTIGVARQSDVRRLRIADRFFLANPLDFGSKDTAIVVLDNDVENKSFEIPFYRKGTTNPAYVGSSTAFSAFDIEAGNVAFTDALSFGAAFDFSNFKVLMQAKKVLKPTPAKTAILYRAVKWGRSGEKITVGYTYPSAANTAVGSTVNVGATVDIRINLASGTAAPNSIDNTTQWNVTITNNSPVAGTDQVTYTWNTVGTNPAMTLIGGEYVNITTQTAFSASNTGIFKVSTEVGFTPTATSFSVKRPTGVATAEAGKATTVNGAITLYSPSPTTAASVKAYVDASLANYITATLANDGGTDGSGVILLSTYEDSAYSYSSVALKDGINWIASNSTGANPQFTLKNALNLFTDSTYYSFVNGEEFRLVPTTMDQVIRFISTLAVTGFTTIGSALIVDRANNLEFSTDVLGGAGAIQIVSGLANSYQTPILDSALRFNNIYATVSVDKVAAQGIHSDQWFKLQSTYEQKKIAGLSSNSNVTVVGNSPATGQTLVTLLNRTLTQRYFGKPRHHIRSKSDTFRVEKQGSLVCISWNKVGTTPGFIKSSLNFNDGGGGTLDITIVAGTSDAQYAIKTGTANFTELSINDLVTVAGMTDSVNNGTFLVTGVSDNGKTIQVLNPSAKNVSGGAYAAGNFTASSGVSEGDTVIIDAPFNILNRGRFRVIREYADSIWIENPTAVEEEVALPYNLILDQAPHYTFTVSGANATIGDTYTNNSQTFTVSKTLYSGTTLICTGTGAPTASGTLIKASGSGDVSITFSANTSGGIGLDSTTSLTITATGNTAYVTWSGAGTQPDLSLAQMGDIVTFGTDFTAVNRGSFMVLRSGTNFLECINPSATTETEVVSGDIFQCHRPQIQFSEYEATVVGDKLEITGSVLTAPNAGSYAIIQVLSRDSAIISGVLANVSNISLNGFETSVFVQEGVPYSGYKKVFLSSAQPGTATRDILLFDTNAQYEKINQSSGTQMISLGKLNFNTTMKNGIDSYRFNTGLIAEANRIIYGDPRDPITYPGVGAAGADIFVKEPLFLRIQVSVDVRLITGAPFNSVAQQIRSNISSLVNSNPVGQSIDISSIIGAARSVPGVQSVAIDSPLFDVANDLILVVPGQKARILDPTLDIQVNQIGR